MKTVELFRQFMKEHEIDIRDLELYLTFFKAESAVMAVMEGKAAEKEQRKSIELFIRELLGFAPDATSSIAMVANAYDSFCKSRGLQAASYSRFSRLILQSLPGVKIGARSGEKVFYGINLLPEKTGLDESAGQSS